MNKLNLLKHAILGFAVLITTTLLHADETQPKFTIIPSTQTKWVIPSNGGGNGTGPCNVGSEICVIYTVTNQTKITRTLTMKPIPGITQKTTGSGVCGSTFTLAHGQSCQLQLPLVGSQLSGHIIGGPVICKTNGHGDNGPDPFLCSQPSRANSLDILSVAPETAVLSVFPENLTLFASSIPSCYSDTLTVTNNSQTVTVSGIHTTLPADWSDVTLAYSPGCTSLAPGHSDCIITFTPGNFTHPKYAFTIIGSTPGVQVTTTADVAVDAGFAPITIDKSSLILIVGGGGQLVTIHNQSACITADHVQATLTQELIEVGVTIAPNPCPSIAPGGDCVMTFTPGTSTVIPANPVPIYGTNTNELTLAVEEHSPFATIGTVCSPESNKKCNKLTLAPGGGTGSLYIKNFSSTIPAAGITSTLAPALIAAGVTQTGNTCGFALAPLQTCKLTFTSGNTIINSTSFIISGSNTNTNTDPPPYISVAGTTLSISTDELVLAQDGSFQPKYGTSPAVAAKPRTITITNTGSVQATSVGFTFSPALPNFTKAISSTSSTTSCGNIQPAATCVITITPGPIPSTPPPAKPIVPSHITISGTNTHPVEADIIILAYGNDYQGGYVFAMDDSPPPGSSIGGKVATHTTVNPIMVWDSTSGCTGITPPQTCVSTNTNSVDGYENTIAIVNALEPFGAIPGSYAASLCDLYPSSTSEPWYLPSQCEMGFTSVYCVVPASNPNVPIIQNILNIVSSGVPSYPPNTLYWSSVQSDQNDAFQVEYYSPSATVSMKAYNKNTNFSVLCAKCFPNNDYCNPSP